MRISDILMEAITNQVTVFYGGRFQPMHKGHYALYKQLVSRFGADNVFIATTFGQKQQKMHAAGNYSTDPFTFEEKADIAYRMFGIPSGHIVDTMPYKPDLSAVGRDASESAIVLAFSEKDAGRLQETEVLRKLPDDESQLQTADENRVYFVTMPVNEGGMSATDFREEMASGKPDDEKEKAFTAFFGKFDQQVFDFINERLN
jgi:hypothetical protein